MVNKKSTTTKTPLRRISIASKHQSSFYLNTLDNVNLKVGLYCRKSTEDKNSQMASIPKQVWTGQAVAKKEKIKIEHTWRETKSAHKLGREEFTEMMSMIYRQEINCVIVYKACRLARNPIDGGQILWALQKGLLQKIITPDRIYTLKDQMLLTIEFGYTTQYSIDLSNNVLGGLSFKIQQGLWPKGGNSIPWGWVLKKDQSLAPHPTQYKHLKYILKVMVIKNHASQAEIILYMKRHHVRTKQGTAPQRTWIRNVLLNPVNAGIVYSGSRFQAEGRHWKYRIIEPDDIIEIKKILQYNHIKSKRNNLWNQKDIQSYEKVRNHLYKYLYA